MMGIPVVVVESGGVPYVQVDSGPSFTVVDKFAPAITLVEKNAPPIALFNPDGTPYAGDGYGPELLLDPTFDQGTTHWSLIDGAVIDEGAGVFIDGSDGVTATVPAPQIGAVYRIAVELADVQSGAYVNAIFGDNAKFGLVTTGLHVFELTPVTSTPFRIQNDSGVSPIGSGARVLSASVRKKL